MGKKEKIFLGAMAMAAAFALFFYLNLPTMKETVIRFPSTYKEKDVTLEASAWKVPDAEYAVLICPGFSCDRQKWRPFANLFVSNGYTTMVVDYAGQGASSSAIGFDNAKTDAIPVEIDDAVEQLHRWSGIAYDHIVLMSHSMGGRAVLRLLHDYNDPNAETTVQKKEIRNVILFSPEVNYSFNAQASLFAGTSDDVEEPWASYDENDITGTNVYIYGSTADDIVSDENILAIGAHLGAADLPESGVFAGERENGNGSRITIGITPGVLHSYQMYSAAFADFANAALSDLSGTEATYPSRKMNLIYVGWALALLGVGFFLSGMTSQEKSSTADAVPELLDAKRFLVRKFLLWIPGLIAAFLICCIAVVLPFGSPVMNTPYMCCIAGYGLIMLLAYRKGRFPGTEGKLPSLRYRSGADGMQEAKNSMKDRISAVVIACLVCFFVWYVLRSSMYRLIPLNARLFWVTFAGILMSMGYFVSGCESDMLQRSGAGLHVRIIYNLIQYVALFLLVMFYLVIGSYSGLIAQVQNMILMYIFCIPLGRYLSQHLNSRFIGAFVTGFLFQTLMITSSALIALF
ncbi:MAG: alpha/beta fold hydrolase [Clostridiales bacterium]|nr:alpha/beta fold hydrolase [Candidatus Blautia equi]